MPTDALLPFWWLPHVTCIKGPCWLLLMERSGVNHSHSCLHDVYEFFSRKDVSLLPNILLTLISASLLWTDHQFFMAKVFHELWRRQVLGCAEFDEREISQHQYLCGKRWWGDTHSIRILFYSLCQVIKVNSAFPNRYNSNVSSTVFFYPFSRKYWLHPLSGQGTVSRILSSWHSMCQYLFTFVYTSGLPN